jgi:hypothetical protein
VTNGVGRVDRHPADGIDDALGRWWMCSFHVAPAGLRPFQAGTTRFYFTY